MAFLQMPEEALQYKRQWVALSPDFLRLVGHGPTPKEALEKAKEGGEEHAVLLYIPDEWPHALIL